jgi:hydroxypyruvate isomerase
MTMPRFSANLGFLWPDRPLLDRIDAAAAAGFKAIELHWPYDVAADAVRRACERHRLKALGLNTPIDSAAALTFCLNGGAFFGEIFRGAVEAIPKGQRKTSTALGFCFVRTLRLVIIPQAVRLMLPESLRPSRS